MSLNTLLESADNYKSNQAENLKIAKKRSRTKQIEGLGGDVQKNNMAMILENQAKQLVNESSQTGGGIASQANFTAGNGEQWAGVALPLVRKVFGQIAAKEFVSVQPMNLPSGLVFFIDFQYGTNKAPFAAGKSIYGDTTAAEQPFGHTNKGGFYGAGRFGYSINDKNVLFADLVDADGNAVVIAAPANAVISDVNYDTTVSLTGLKTVKVPAVALKYVDLAGIRGFSLLVDGATTGSADDVTINLPQYTRFDGVDVIFVVDSALGTANKIAYQLQPTDQYRGDFEDMNPALNEANVPIEIPEINVQMKSSSITAKTRKLKAVWTPEFAQDLNAYHSVDAEAELTGILSEYISLEIDLEILDMLMTNAGSGTEVWSAKNNNY